MSGENNRHFSDDELILRLYSESSASGGGHIAQCDSCRERWNTLVRQREAFADESAPALSVEFLQKQRRGILSGIHQPAPSSVLGLRNAWVPTVVAALLVMGLIATTPGTKRPAPKAASTQLTPEVADAAWYEDAYSASQPVEPRAASAIRGLFSEGPVAR
ncbi:MAG: hypothetical protein ABI811_10975 [Acidobacteriota bacterium]